MPRLVGDTMPLPGLQVRTDAGARDVGSGVAPSAAGWETVYALEHASETLALAPTTGTEPADVEAFPAQRIGRSQAWLRMLLALRQGDGRQDWAAIVRAVWELCVGLVRGRRGEAVAHLIQRYRGGPPPAPRAEKVRPDTSLSCIICPGLLLGSARTASLVASGDLVCVLDENGSLLLEATGDDPQLRFVHAAGAAPLPGGWYRFRARLTVEDGEINSPCLYPDYGSGLDQSTQIVLPAPDRGGQLSSVILLKHDVLQLRFDPSIRRARFRVQGLRLERLSRAGAAVRMLASLRQGWHFDGNAMMAALGDAVRSFATAGSRPAGEALHRHYLGFRWPGAGSYESWVRMYDTLTPGSEAMLRRRAAALVDGPLVSVLLPVYQTPERWLRRCIDSVMAQAYTNWELCIADDASPSPRVRQVLAGYARRDSRIRVIFRARNGHISEASNTALEMARGRLVALLDHDDELRPHALLEMAEASLRYPEARLLYSDEDKIDERGRRFEPYFKPDWNPDLLLAQNYLCHLTVLDRELAVAVGGFRPGFEGSQDHDLFLRCIEQLEPHQIHHVPKVLYHWRAVPGSTALRRDAKDYAAAAGARAVAEHLARAGANALVEQLPHGHFRVRWPVPVPAPRVSLVVPTRDKPTLLRTCVESILAPNRYPGVELLVVDNQSSDPEALELLARLAEDERVRVLRYDAPFNYSAINNFAVAQATGDVIGLVNNDIEVLSGDWLQELVAHAVRPGIGAVGAMLRYPDGSIQHAGVVLGVGGIANHPFQHQPRGYPGHGARALVAHNLSAVTAACLFVRRELYLKAGGLDERLAVAFNDVDFCLRLVELGYRNLWTPFVDIVHHESASRGREDTPEKEARFRGEVEFMQERWAHRLYADPYYNPNLTLDTVNFELAFPPRS